MKGRISSTITEVMQKRLKLIPVYPGFGGPIHLGVIPFLIGSAFVLPLSGQSTGKTCDTLFLNQGKVMLVEINRQTRDLVYYRLCGDTLDRRFEMPVRFTERVALGRRLSLHPGPSGQEMPDLMKPEIGDFDGWIFRQAGQGRTFRLYRSRPYRFVVKTGDARYLYKGFVERLDRDSLVLITQRGESYVLSNADIHSIRPASSSRKAAWYTGLTVLVIGGLVMMAGFIISTANNISFRLGSPVSSGKSRPDGLSIWVTLTGIGLMLAGGLLIGHASRGVTWPFSGDWEIRRVGMEEEGVDVIVPDSGRP